MDTQQGLPPVPPVPPAPPAPDAGIPDGSAAGASGGRRTKAFVAAGTVAAGIAAASVRILLVKLSASSARPMPPDPFPDLSRDVLVSRADQAVHAARDLAAATDAAGLNGNPLSARVTPAVVRLLVRDDQFKVIAQGSGFFVSSDGLIVTNHRVIDGANFITAERADGGLLFVDGVAGVDPEHDLALLRVKANGLPHLELSAVPRPAVGTKVYAAGFPHGLRNSMLSPGLVADAGDAPGSDGSGPIPITAVIGFGYSGGPLLGADGTVLGVTRAALRSMAGAEGNVAVPVALVRQLLQKRAAGGEVKALASAGDAPLGPEAALAMHRIWAAVDGGDARAALAVVTESREKLKDSVTYWLIAGTLHLQAKSHASGEEAFRNAAKLKPDSAACHGALAAALYFQGKHREAIKAYEAASKLAPKEPKHFAAAGTCYMHLKQPDRAVAFFKRAAQLAPGDADSYRQLASCYAALGQHADAMMAVKQAIKLRPNDAEAHLSLAGAYHGLKRPEDAMDSLKRAATLNPRHARAHLMIGVLHLEAHRPAEALTSWRTAARLDPNGEIGQVAAKSANDLESGLKAHQQQRQQQQQQIQQQQLQQAQQRQQQPQRRTPVQR